MIALPAPNICADVESSGAQRVHHAAASTAFDTAFLAS